MQSETRFKFQGIFRALMIFMLFIVLAWAANVWMDKLPVESDQPKVPSAMDYTPKPLLYNDNGDGFVVIAHRGASGHAPENTMAAFKKAVEMGAEMMELDVLLSADGVPMCFHDASLDRCTNASGLFTDFTYDSLKTLDAGSWFDPAFAGEPIPTLDEVLAYAKGKITVNIEIKTESVTDELRGGVEEKCLELVKKHDMMDYVIFSSFDYRALKHLRELAPEVTTALLYAGADGAIDGPVALTEHILTDAFNCSWKELSPEWITQLQDRGVPFNIYTVNDAEKMRELIQAGASGIFSDYPDQLIEAAASLQ